MKCKLCLQDINKLCNSHIIPEFYHKSIYNKKHQITGKYSESKQSMDLMQKGLREFMLCKSCEDKLSKYEKYVKVDFYENIKKLKGDTNYYKINKLNYKAIKLFQLSVLWKAANSTNIYYKFVTIAPKHNEAIRAMLYNENPGKYFEYGCAMILLFKQNKLKDNFITVSDSNKYKGHNVISFVFGGIKWSFFVSSHMNTLDNINLFIKEDGSLILPCKDISEIRSINQIFNAFGVNLY
jgi:hypothetical protein